MAFTSKVLTKDGYEPITALELKDKNNVFLSDDDEYFVRGQNPKKPCLCRLPIFLDTETSHNHNKENPRAWVHQFAFKFGSCYFCGRTPNELIEWLSLFVEKLGLNDKRKVVVYVHNLSYDIQYLKEYLIEKSETFNVLALKSHKYLQVETDHFVFRCSYLFSNRSLSAWCKSTGSYYLKDDGAIDYNLIRYQDDDLTDNEWSYQFSDVASMSECWRIEKGDTFNVHNVPLTSTGFVRHDGRSLFRKNGNNREKFQKERLTPELYSICRDAFAGGYTHGNRHFRGKLVTGNIKHFDYRSFYPSTTRIDYFPDSPFTLFYKHTNGKEYPKKDIDIMLKNKCCVMTVLFENGQLNPHVTAPYLSAHKVFKGRMTNMTKIEDNGRILAFDGVTVLNITELDFKWIMKQYDFKNVIILEMYIAERGTLPEWFTNLTDKFFYNKNNLKDVNPLEYAKSKNKLNSIYGMSATDIVRDEWKMNTETGEWSSEHPDIPTALDKYYGSRNSFMSYQYGLYVTAHCRDRLHTMICDVIGYENFLYADTDSAFFISNYDIEKRIAKINNDNLMLCKSMGAGVTDKHGNFVEYMTFEDEHDEITQFKFLHSKCYGMIAHGKLSITIAGVTSKWRDGSGRTREDELQNLDNLENGFVFNQCGGTTSEYIEDKPHDELIDGHVVSLAGSCIIRDVEYTIKDIYDVWVMDVEQID